MRISDWSSDVCSSDLIEAEDAHVQFPAQLAARIKLRANGAAKGRRIAIYTRIISSLPEIAPVDVALHIQVDEGRHTVEAPQRATIAGVVALIIPRSEIIPLVHLTATSEERRVGKECVSPCRSGWSPCTSKKKH